MSDVPETAELMGANSGTDGPVTARLLRGATTLTTLLLGVAACQEASQPPPPAIAASPDLPRLREVPLALPAEGLDLRPHNLAVTSDGRISVWVRHNGPNQILTLDSTGAMIASWGRIGEGPGEIRSADLLLSGDSTVVIAGISGEPVRVFRSNGEFLVQKSRPPVGLPSAPANGRMVWWTAKHLGKGARDAASRVVREGPLMNWCVFSSCSGAILASTDTVVQIINTSAPPPDIGLWPAFATRGDIVIVGDGYSYSLWKVDLGNPKERIKFGRELPPRMATDSQIARAESRWVKLERGVPGPNGQVVRDNFDREREHIRTIPRPHFQYLGMGFDGRGRLWVIGRDSTASLFVDVFSDTTYLGRRPISCNRNGYAAAVRGRWFATICDQGEEAENRFALRLFEIVETDAVQARK